MEHHLLLHHTKQPINFFSIISYCILIHFRGRVTEYKRTRKLQIQCSLLLLDCETTTITSLIKVLLQIRCSLLLLDCETTILRICYKVLPYIYRFDVVCFCWTARQLHCEFVKVMLYTYI